MENDRVGDTQAPPNKLSSQAEKNKTTQPIDGYEGKTSPWRENELQPPPSHGHKQKTYKKCPYTRDPGMFWISVVMLVAVIGYAWYARRQAIGTEKAAPKPLRSVRTLPRTPRKQPEMVEPTAINRRPEFWDRWKHKVRRCKTVLMQLKNPIAYRS